MNVSLVCGNYIVCMYCHGNHLVHTSGRDFFQNYILFLRNCSFIWVASTMKSTSKYFHFKCFYWNLISPVAAGWCFYFKLDSQLQLRWQLLSINSSSGKQTNKTLSFLTARKKQRARMIYLTGIVQVTMILWHHLLSILGVKCFSNHSNGQFLLAGTSLLLTSTDRRDSELPFWTDWTFLFSEFYSEMENTSCSSLKLQSFFFSKQSVESLHYKERGKNHLWGMFLYIS